MRRRIKDKEIEFEFAADDDEQMVVFEIDRQDSDDLLREHWNRFADRRTSNG